MRIIEHVGEDDKVVAFKTTTDTDIREIVFKDLQKKDSNNY